MLNIEKDFENKNGVLSPKNGYCSNYGFKREGNKIVSLDGKYMLSWITTGLPDRYDLKPLLRDDVTYKEIEEKDLKKEEIQDHICNLNKEKEMINNELGAFDFDKMLLSAAISLLVNFFGSKKLDKEKLINFVVDTIESSQDEICEINEVLHLAKSKLA